MLVRPRVTPPVKSATTVSISMRVSQPLGYFHLQPVSGKSIDEEIVLALKALGAQRDDVLVLTIAREKKGGR